MQNVIRKTRNLPRLLRRQREGEAVTATKEIEKKKSKQIKKHPPPKLSSKAANNLFSIRASESTPHLVWY